VVGLSEVDELDAQLPTHHHVIRLQVHVDDAVALQVPQSLGYREHQVDLAMQGEALLLISAELGQGRVSDAVHEEVVREAAALISDDVVAGQEARHAALDVVQDFPLVGHAPDLAARVVALNDHWSTLRWEAL
jgi:hypothetical protein